MVEEAPSILGLLAEGRVLPGCQNVVWAGSPFAAYCEAAVIFRVNSLGCFGSYCEGTVEF